MTADVLARVVVNGNVDTPDVTREEVAKAMRRIQRCRTDSWLRAEVPMGACASF